MAIDVTKQMTLSLDGVVIGCAQTVTWGASRERKNANCQALGDVAASTPGRKSYTLSVDALMRVATGTDAAGNTTFVDIETLFEAGTIFAFEVGPDEIGATKKSGTAWVESYEESSPLEDNPTWSCSFAVSDVVTYTVNA